MKLKLVIVFFFAIITSGLSQKIETDHANFYNPDGSFSWEFYYSISNDQLVYEHDADDKYVASIECRLSVFDTVKKDTVISDSWTISDYRSVKDSTIRDLIGQKNYKLDEGIYKAVFEYPHRKHKTKSESFTFTLESSNDNASLGDIQLARNVEKNDKKTVFNKYGFYIVPNPEAVYATNQMDIYLCHSYKVVKDLDDDSEYSLRYKLLDAAKMPVRKELQNISLEKDNNIYFNYFSTSLSGLPSGVYYIVVELYKDIYLHESKEKKFYVYNYEIPLETTLVFTEDELFEMSEFATMTDQQVDLALKMAEVIAHDTDRELFDRLTTVKGKQRALYRFWSLRDRDTSTRVNETLIDFNRRVRYANKHFSTNQEGDGWDSDRGRILIKYGFPDDKDIHSVSMENRAWEEWHYTRYEGGAFFYFVERLGYNDYILVHSTVTGEMYNPDWFEKYVPTSLDDRTPYELDNEKNSR